MLVSCPMSSPPSFDHRSNYNPSLYQNGGHSPSPSSALEQFSFSDLPNLDYGSPDEDEGVLGRGRRRRRGGGGVREEEEEEGGVVEEEEGGVKRKETRGKCICMWKLN